MSTDTAPPHESRRQRRDRIAAQTAARYAGLALGQQITAVPLHAAEPSGEQRRATRSHQRYTPRQGMARDRRALDS